MMIIFYNIVVIEDDIRRSGLPTAPLDVEYENNRT